MDFKALLEPYCEPDADSKPLRTVEGQVKWLTSKGIPREYIDQALLSVYDEIERGKTFEDGRALDHYLLEVAKGLNEVHLSKQVAALEAFMGSFRETWEAEFAARNTPRFWKRVKGVFKPALLMERKV